jgi:uncharacterized membrane protein
MGRARVVFGKMDYCQIPTMLPTLTKMRGHGQNHLAKMPNNLLKFLAAIVQSVFL